MPSFDAGIEWAYNALMRIIKCDICNQEIDSGMESFRLERRGKIMTFANFEICFACSEPITKLLKDKKLIKEDGSKK